MVEYMTENIGMMILIAIVMLGAITWLLKGMMHSVRTSITRAKGIKTTAVIKEMGLGGSALGNEFSPAVTLRVLVENEKGKLYSAQIETTIATTHMPRFQPGCKIDVAYDPANPQKVVMLSPTSRIQEEYQASKQAAFDKYLIEKGVTSQEMIDIANNGIKAQGIILSVQPTGNVINGWEEMALDIHRFSHPL
ncbi:MAG: DUF3592 domain-containing protein [Peptococcaceae bacterium]|nr:DUF3592 domain-containing protein [Peptococcaceae bacterium]